MNVIGDSASSFASGQDAPSGSSDSDPNKATEVAEVLVTATKREESVQDIPISIAVIGSEDIERRSAVGMEDYLRSIPGVNQIDNGAQSNAIVIRGITTSPEFENFGSGTTVASYFDETPITGAAGIGAGGIDIRPVDIERIEVLRGPQGTAYGSASLGGTLRTIPAKPKLDAFGARLVASLADTGGNGSENSMMQGVVNIPLVEDKFALRAVGYRYDESGFYKNIAANDPTARARAEAGGLGELVDGYLQDDVGQIVSTGGRLAGLWKATDQFNLSFNYLSQKIEQDGRPIADAGRYDQATLPIAPQGRIRGEEGEVADTKIDLFNVVGNYDLGWAALTAAASWVDGGSKSATDLYFLPFPGSTTAIDDFKSFTAETRLASNFEGRFQFLGGVFFEDISDDYAQTADWPGTPETSPVGTNPMLVSDISRDLEQRAIFGEVSYDITDKLKGTVGGRYFDYDKDERTLREGGFAGGVPIGGGTPVNLSSSKGDSSFKANLSYDPTKNSLLYLSWAEGFRLGRPSAGVVALDCDTNGDGLIDGSNVTVDSSRTINSDFLENYEIGGKFTLLDRRMVIDTSVYHIKWDGLPITTRVPGSAPNCSFTANAGAATSDGVELQVSVFAMAGLRFDFGGAYTKAELSEDAPALFAQDGAPLPGSPKVSANLSAQYDFDVRGLKTFVRADSFYAGKFYGDLLETPGTQAGDYIKVDARAGVAIRNLSVELFVRNLTDEDAFTWRGLGNANSFYGYRLRPRTIGIQLGYSFE